MPAPSPSPASGPEDLLGRLRSALVTGPEATPVWAEVRPDEITLRWLRVKALMPVYSRDFEERRRAALGPDLFGRRQPPPPPPNAIDELDESEHPAAWLDRISLTHCGGWSGRPLAEKTSRYRRSAEERRWGHRAGTPKLPELTIVPHLVHVIWLGGPVPNEKVTAFRRNIAAGARRYAGAVDFVVWTDVTRAEVVAALAGAPGSRAKTVRSSVEWARAAGVSLVNVDEVFHAARPMVLSEEYAVERTKRLPRGWAGASDSLRLDLIYRFGGAYVDGDNSFDVPPEALAPVPDGVVRPSDLPGLFDAVAASLPGFTLAITEGRTVAGDVIVAPAGHPAIRLWQELTRVMYGMRQVQLFGGLERMTDAAASSVLNNPETEPGKALPDLSTDLGTPISELVNGPEASDWPDGIWARYTVPLRAGRVAGGMLHQLGLGLYHPSLVRASGAVRSESEQSWSRTQLPTVPDRTPDQVADVLIDLLTATTLRLASREGNLRLTALAPVIATLPDPDRAWAVLLRMLAELVRDERLPPVTSVTDSSRRADGRIETVALPPEAQNLLDRRWAGTGWLGAELAVRAVGRPVWLLEESVVPARLCLPVRDELPIDPGSAPAVALHRRLALAQNQRLRRAAHVLEQVESRLDRSGTRPPRPGRTAPEMQKWLDRLTNLSLGTAGFEQELRSRLGADVFGLWPVPVPSDPVPGEAPPGVGAGSSVTDLAAVTGVTDLSRVVPDRVAPLLRALSLTRCEATGLPPEPGLRPEADLGVPAPVARYQRTAEERHWGQPEDVPQLPQWTVIPKVVHAVWLGSPLPSEEFRRNFAAGARRYAGTLDFVLWTDLGRAEVEAALAGAPEDRAGQIRTVLAWAAEHGISLIDWREVFDADHPLLAHDQVVAQARFALRPGFAGAGAQLAVEVIARFGGIHADGDLTLVPHEKPHGPYLPDLGSMPEQVAASRPGYTADLVTGADGVRQVMVAPAGHPAIRLWQELSRLVRAHRLSSLIGGAESMVERYAGRRAELRWRRDPVSIQTHQAQLLMRRRLSASPDVLVPVLVVPPAGSMVQVVETAYPSNLSEDEIVQQVLVVLIRQLEMRSGDLHLVEVAPLISEHPDADAVWIAVLRFLVVMAERGVVRPVTSVTRFRWSDEGVPEYVSLPPEAEVMLEYGSPVGEWLGSGLMTPGRPVWVLDELVAPATLGRGPVSQVGPGSVDRTLTSDLLAPAGAVGLALTGLMGVAWHAGRRIRPEDAARQLAAQGLLGHPVWLRVSGGVENGSAAFAEKLSALIKQPVTVVEAQARPDRPASDQARSDSPGQDPELLLKGLRERAATAVPLRWVPPEPPEPILTWLRSLVDDRLYQPDFEAESERRSGPDLFGLTDRILGLHPDSEPGVLSALTGDGAELVVPLLRRMSLTNGGELPAVPVAQALAEVRNGADRGLVTRRALTPKEREWGHPDAPPLPPETVIPHVMHAIWLGGPVPEGGVYRHNIGEGASRWAGQVEVVLWTDLTREEVRVARAGRGGTRGAQVRSTLDWAVRHNISLVNVFEMFGPGDQMVSGREFVREYVKALPRGYAGASDVLRLEIVAMFGGAYTDGDNSFSQPDLEPLPELFEAVAASEPGFTVDYLGDGKINNDVVVGPAGHPALRLFREVTRVNFRLPQRELLGGPERMSQNFVGHQVELMRFSTVRRTGRCHHVALHYLGYDAEDPRPVHPTRMIRHGSELSWGRRPAPRRVKSEEDVLDRLEFVVTTLARQVVNRDGDLYLTEIAPVIAGLPAPDAAWTAILRFLAELQADERMAEIRSVTEIRRDSDDVMRYVPLPPAAEACLQRLSPEEVTGDWLGEGIQAPGEPVWMQDEIVAPARLRPPQDRPDLPPRLHPHAVNDADGRLVGLDLTDGRRGGAGPQPVPPGCAGLWLTARWGEPIADGVQVRAADLAQELSERPGLAGRPVLIFPDPAGHGGLDGFAERLAQCLGQVVTIVGALVPAGR